MHINVLFVNLCKTNAQYTEFTDIRAQILNLNKPVVQTFYILKMAGNFGSKVFFKRKNIIDWLSLKKTCT